MNRKHSRLLLSSLIALLSLTPIPLHAADPAGTAAPISILDKLSPSNNAIMLKNVDGIKVNVKLKSDLGKISTSAQYATPLVMTAVIKNEGKEIRLFYGTKGSIILNWQAAGNGLRHHDPMTGEEVAVPFKWDVPNNTYITIRWTLDVTNSRVVVDGIERAVFKKDYSGLTGVVGVGTYDGVLIRSLQVASPDITAKGLDITEAKWGAADDMQDVTQKVKDLMNDGRLDLTANMATLGSVKKTPRQLTLNYILAGVAVSERYPESSKISVVPPAGADSQAVQEINDLIDARRYSDALARIASQLALSTSASGPTDRLDLLMLKAECLLQIKDAPNAQATLGTAQRAAKKKEDAYKALGFSELIKNSPKGVYTSKTDKRPHDILDRAKRKEAYESIWADAYSMFSKSADAALRNGSLTVIVQTADAVPTYRAAEYMATEKTEKCDTLIIQLRDRSAKLLEAAIKEQLGIADKIGRAADTLVQKRTKEGQWYWVKQGLSTIDQTTLGEIQKRATLYAGAAKQLAQSLGSDEPFAALGAQASQLGQAASQIMATSY